MFGLPKLYIALGAVLLIGLIGIKIYDAGGDARDARNTKADQEQADEIRQTGDATRNETSGLDDDGIIDSLCATGGLREDC